MFWIQEILCLIKKIINYSFGEKHEAIVFDGKRRIRKTHRYLTTDVKNNDVIVDTLCFVISIETDKNFKELCR